MRFCNFYEFARQTGVLKWAYRYGLWQFRKRILRRDSWLTLPTGLRIFLPRTSGSASEAFVTNAETDWGSEALFSSLADPQDDFIDVGAHIGYYSLYLSPLVKRVFSFEPDSRNHETLLMNTESVANITVEKKAASDVPGAGFLDVSNNSGVSHLASNKNSDTTEIEVTTIDDFAKSIESPNIKLIKIDVEGNDLNVVKGALGVIRDQQPLILTEFTSDGSGKNDFDELVRICQKVSYRIFAYTREKADQKKPTFAELGQSNSDVKAKMLFLAPQRLHENFEGLLSR